MRIIRMAPSSPPVVERLRDVLVQRILLFGTRMIESRLLQLQRLSRGVLLLDNRFGTETLPGEDYGIKI